jgi:hypothetical protein
MEMLINDIQEKPENYTVWFKIAFDNVMEREQKL